MAALKASLLGGVIPEAAAACTDRWEERRAKELAACADEERARHAAQGGGASMAGEVFTCTLAGVLLWLMTLALAVGFATFAFLAMPSQTHLAISMQMLGTAVCYVWLGVRSRNPASCVQASPIPAIYISIFIKSCEAAGLAPGAEISTVLLFVWVTTLFQGLSFVICTRYHMGDVLQYFPVSVTTGYNGGIGLLILNASISMMAGVNPLEDLNGFLQQGPLLLALPGVLLALVVYPLSLTCTGPAFKVLPILSTIVAFYGVLYSTGTSLSEARDMGWVFPYYGYSKPTDVMTSFDYATVDWEVFGSGATLVPPMAFISMIAQYASLGAILMQVAETTKDADEETRHLGQATLISSFLGSMANLSGMAPSALFMGVVGKKVARGASLVICGLLHLGLFLSGFPLVSYLPKCSIAGCLLLPIAFKMLRGALLESLAFSTWGDYVVIWVMSWTTLMMNIQWGLASGFILSVFRLLYEYADLDVVDRRESLGKVLTLKGRDACAKHIIEDHGEEVAAYRLKGVLFFGNCVSLKLELSKLIDGVKDTVMGLSRPPPKFVVVDFSEVIYADSSVWDILASATGRALRVSSTELYLCGLNGELRRELMRQGEQLLNRMNLESITHSYLLMLEQIEDRILQMAEIPSPPTDGWKLFTAWVAGSLPQGQEAGEELRSRLQKYFRECKYSEGEVVQKEHSPALAFYWVMAGEFHTFGQASGGTALAKSPALARRYFQKGVQEVATRRASKASADLPHEVALLHAKLTQGFIAGCEIFSREAALGPSTINNGQGQVDCRPMRCYTSIQCKHAGKLLRLSREDFERLRLEDPQLCVALLLSVASSREAQLRSYMLQRIEPEQVEVVDGLRRRFTMPTSAENIRELVRTARYSPLSNAALIAKKILDRLQRKVIRIQDQRDRRATEIGELTIPSAAMSYPN